MTYAKLLGLGLLVAALATLGCSPNAGGTKPVVKNKEKGKEAAHAHGKGPNGGVVFDLGAYHAEFTVDHDKKQCTTLILGDDEKTVAVAAVKELTLTTKESKTKEGKVVPPMTIKLVPQDVKDGKSSKLIGTDEGLGNVADFEGTIIGEIDGQPAEGKFKEE
jgi:hypothetical protein